MSDMFDADDYADYMQEDCDSSIEWKTKDGRVILIKDMTKSHLENIICYLRKKGERSHLIEKELKARF